MILPSLELLKSAVPESHAPILADCTGAAERAADLVHKLMTYAGKRTPRAPRPCEVPALVERVVALCERAFDRHIELSCVVSAPGALVSADPADVEQVLMNLLLNARDAVNTPAVPKPRIDVRVGLETPTTGKQIVVHVRDNGGGMDAETLRRACEPFFTTKDVGAGTGLGLATSSAIARELGGQLELDSEPGKGTRATLRLPLLARHPVATPPVREPAAAASKQVLLIDDDPLVRTATTRVLELRGHKVLSVGDGAAAIEAAGRQAFEVLLIDRSLPDIQGGALVTKLRALAPKARAYFFTGHELSAEEAAEVDGVVYKPVRTAELLAAVVGS
ncbi:MAG: response regulator [Deltaproteobacteria bacterium]|nr:response regulator [Deltaproteobacteria bacterium]